MVVKLKNILCSLLLIIGIIYISSCTYIPEIEVGTEYEITYIYNNEIIEHSPSTYKNGTITFLKDLEVEGFEGWYTSPTFSGKKVTQIDLTQKGDITYYAKISGNIIPTEYKITYIYNNEVIEHEPSTYQAGLITYLNNLEVEGFEGWYTSQDEKITQIGKTVKGDLILYAKVNNEATPDPVDLAEIFKNMTNYAFTYSYVSVDGGDSYVSYNEYDNGNIKQSGYDYYDEYYEDFLINKNGSLTIYTKDYDGSYIYITQDDIYFESYYSLFDIVVFDKINPELFTLVDGAYELTNAEDINKIGKLLLGDFENDTFIKFRLEVENDHVSKITAVSNYFYEGEYYTYDYEVVFSKFNTVKFDVPSVDNPIQSTMTIEQVYNASDDTTVITKGYVNGIVGNNIYIQDDTGGVYLYLGNNSSISSYLSIGDEIVVEGLKTTYKGLVEISEITSIDVTGTNKNISKENLDSVDETSLKNNLCKLVDISNVTLVTVPSNYLTATTDISFEVTDGINSITLFLSKHIDSITREYIFNSTLKNGDSIDLDNIVVGYFNDYQLVISAFTTISKTTTDIPPVNPTEISKAPSSTKKLEDVLPTLGVENGEVYGVSKGLPSTGNPQVLVIPIAFTDYPAPTNIQKELETSFFGTSSETGWESLKSYYYKSSYGKLNISGTVLPAYNTGKTSSYYEYKDDGDYLFIKAALEYYDGIIDYSDYDYDKDGYIDSIYFIYTCPYNSTDDESLYWAYTYEYYTDDYEYYDNVEADFYVLASYHFLFDELANGSKVKYNLETYIHETGHLLGSDDYYDYDESIGPYGGIGGGDMMDYNVGDHNPFTKIILGWTTPYLMGNTSSTIRLNSFSSTGDVLMIPKSFNGTYFDEYYLIDFYTPDGLNESEAGYSGLFDVSGIRIYHVDATLKDPSDAWAVWEIYKYNNSDTSHKLIKLIEADGNNHIENENYGYSEDTDLFKEGSSYKNSKWYDGTYTNFIINVINIENTYAEIEIIIK